MRLQLGVVTPVLFVALAAGPAPVTPIATLQPCSEPYRVTREEILAAMARHGDYNLTATTTSMRFGAEALLELVRRRRAEDPASTRLFVDQLDWFSAHRETAGVTYDEMSASARAAFEHRQDALVEYGPHVLQEVLAGPTPVEALDVTISWPDTGDAPSSFTYRDTLSVPRIEVHDSRVVRFRLVQYPDMLLFDEIDGISVKPLGFLSAVFALVGKPDLKQTRLAVSTDQWQVIRGRVKVLPGVSKTGTAAIEPNGRGHEDSPAGRADLDSLERRIAAPASLRYGEPACDAGR